MNREETKKIMDLLNANYDIYSKDPKDENKNILLTGTWHSILKFYNYNDVGLACGEYISSIRIKPKPSDIKTRLDAMKAKRHSTYKQIENSQKLDCEAKLTRQNLMDVFNREFAPFLKMNLSYQLREELRDKHDQKSIDDIVTKIWSYVSTSDFQVFHIEMAISEVKGTEFTFERFMKALVGCREFADDFNENKRIKR